MFSSAPMRQSSVSGYDYPTVDQDEKRSINSEMWHACAGPLVSLPPVGSHVVYFPQGHAEQVAMSTQEEADMRIPMYPNLPPPQLICLLDNATLHEEKESMFLPGTGIPNKQSSEFFCKTLTASDTSTHGGFSIPRRAAEKDYTQQPPAQELFARDLHDQEWHFRHIYRGQPRRHLLTTGWSVVVSAKRLQAVMKFLGRDDKNQLLLSIRRANRQQTIIPSSVLSSDSMHIGILAAASHAAATSSRFTIFYNPRQSPSEFVIPLVKFKNAVYNTQVAVGMRFRMRFEIEESSVRRCMGTVMGISDLDPVRWPKSPWRSLKVGWDEYTIDERQRRVSLWEIERLTTPFLICPPSFSLRSKRGRGLNGEDEDLETLMKTQLWPNSTKPLRSLNFGGFRVDPSWMRVPQQRSGLNISSPQNGCYLALAAAALQEIRTGDPSKPQMQYRLQQSQTQGQSQQSMQQMNDIPGPLLQLSTSGGQTPNDMESSIKPTSNYTESELHILSPSLRPFSVQGMMGRTQCSGPVSSIDGSNFSSLMHPNQNALQPCGSMPESNQAPSWFSTLNGEQAESQSAASPRLNRMEASNAYGFPNSGSDSDQLQAERGHFLFGVSINQPLVTSSGLPSNTFGKTKDVSGNSMSMGSFCSPATSEIPGLSAGVIPNECLDDNILLQRSMGWPAAQITTAVRSFTKVHDFGSVGRSLDIRNFSNYGELRKELAHMFHLDCLMDDSEQSGWQIVFVDNENDSSSRR